MGKSYIDDLIKKIEEVREGDYVTARDIISLGLATNIQSLLLMKKKGRGPNFIQTSKRSCKYPKKDFIEWVRSKWNQV